LAAVTTVSADRGDDVVSSATLVPPALSGVRASEDRVQTRLDELAGLSGGWDGHDAKRIDQLALTLACRLMQQALHAGLPEPELFPVPDGGVQLEWKAGALELELEIEPGARALVFACDDERSGQRIDGELPRDESRFRLALARFNAYAWLTR
jgi:hypothetical protein